MAEYWCTAQQVSDIAMHLEAWGNSFVSVVLDAPDLFLVTMTNPIPAAEIQALELTEV